MSIKNELRLSNWVLYIENYSGDESELYVHAMNDEDAELSNAHSIYQGVKWDNIHPLPVYDWHLAFAGFTTTDKVIYTLGEWKLNLTTDTLTWKDQLLLEHIKYVHQLQNTVAVLSGLELDFKLMGVKGYG